MKNALYALGAIIAGIAFYFTIIGVFELTVACVALALFISAALCAWIFEPDTDSARTSQPGDREGR
jgi:hypothetical protein